MARKALTEAQGVRAESPREVVLSAESLGMTVRRAQSHRCPAVIAHNSQPTIHTCVLDGYLKLPFLDTQAAQTCVCLFQLPIL